ncbi:MAG: aminotransferase class I/II-fold pyridoxal phosphate-dependent enzyme [Leadbetterella sp.]
MEKLSPSLKLMIDTMTRAESMGVIKGQFTDSKLNGTSVRVEDRDLVHFANCSYLCLEHDPRIKEAAKEAINNYGITFSCSRTYLESHLFGILEEKLGQLFGKPVIVPPTTSLGHISWIPYSVHHSDAIIMDQQVHKSVQNACMIAKANGTHLEIVRHNRMDLLEERIIELSKNHSKVWYMADGVYSMFGDVAPMQELYDLMDRYEQFHLYVDDAHGMSWAGENGKGYALSQVPNFHDKLCLMTSLSKGFGVNGAAMVFANEAQKSFIRTVGAALVYSIPLAPLMLAAAIASADIHLSDEIYEKQNILADRMRFFVDKANALNLPIVRQDISPIGFIGVGADPVDTMEVGRNLQKDGYFVNVSSFPIVPLKNAGVRITINTVHTEEAISGLLTCLKNRLDEKGIDKDEVMKAFTTRQLRVFS